LLTRKKFYKDIIKFMG